MAKVRKPATESVTLRDFVNDLMVVKAPRWVWWALVVLALIPVGVSLGVTL